MEPQREVIIQRGFSGMNGIFGSLVTDKGFTCRTLERPDQGEHPCIYKDRFKVVWTVGVHPHHPECYEITNVRDRTAILIHSANIYLELLGCIALGKTASVFVKNSIDITRCMPPYDMMGITQSVQTIKDFLDNLKDKDGNQQDFWLTIK